ncbi:putative dolichyl-phosphate-mannose--protein mannosyltransferase [Tsuneonella dongtanensis]|uniref:Polyprenol-phosphate-mannose--protein mannosyltransferase n=1 Tax=Tsuneonella dongtanensis TaxID=692370 RepID=A0A1B2AC93_9SPHN|nr:glycosyltransferase family 39 protein [Tsuneonella dongtanensis]ANY19773.1 putative dolichyl-phosphate-mannose--protein mannosyltransferase [Tsuneonella dongtanensis]
MSLAPHHPRDPAGWCAVLVAAFFALCLVRLGVPSKPYFDEVHYLPAARALLDGSDWLNREHPMLGKQVIAAGIALLGDTPFAWRLPSALAGALALWAAMRALWFASLRAYATIAYGLLLASGFLLFVHARIAMLDAFMVAFLAVAFWQCAAAVREPEHGRRSLALAGIALGLALAAKWNAAALAPLPGLAFLGARLHACGWKGLWGHRGAPVPGVRLPEAALWLGAVPIAVYAASFWPAWWIEPAEMADRGFIGLHQMMLQMQESVVKPHPYQSMWFDWVIDRRAIWYLYEPVDGAQRGVLLIGNPLSMLAGLVAVGWAAWAGVKGRRMDALAVAAVYAVSLGFWLFAAKPVQFYYHYFVPSMALLAALALALDELRTRGWGWLSWTILTGSLALFVWFYPILSAGPLPDARGFEKWMWIDSWR